MSSSKPNTAKPVALAVMSVNAPDKLLSLRSQVDIQEVTAVPTPPRIDSTSNIPVRKQQYYAKLKKVWAQFGSVKQSESNAYQHLFH